MILTGLTGGIGTGKSTVAAGFARRGLPVVDADRLARQAVAPGGPAYGEIVEAFGRHLVAHEGAPIDRAALRHIAFSSPEQRRRLEAIVHPVVRRFMAAEIDRARRAGAARVLLDVPLLFETGLDRQVAETVVVYAPEQVQVARLATRDGLSDGEARTIISHQMPLDEKCRRADWVLLNVGSLDELDEQVEALWRFWSQEDSQGDPRS